MMSSFEQRHPYWFAGAQIDRDVQVYVSFHSKNFAKFSNLLF